MCNYHALLYSWISEQVMAKENNTWSFSSVVSGWTKVTKERHCRACLAQRRRVFLHGRSLTKILPGLFFAVWLVPSKTAKFNHCRKFVPIRDFIGSPCILKIGSIQQLQFFTMKLRTKLILAWPATSLLARHMPDHRIYLAKAPIAL